MATAGRKRLTFKGKKFSSDPDLVFKRQFQQREEKWETAERRAMRGYEGDS